jgi:hypothetical protein
MEFCAWALISLVPKALSIAFRHSDWIGLLGYVTLPACMAIATGRAAHSAKIGARSFVALIGAFTFIIAPVAAFLPVDTRWCIMTIQFMPAPYAAMNPAGGNSELKLFLANMWFAGVSAVVVRICLGTTTPTRQHYLAAALASCAFAAGLGVHFFVERNAWDFVNDRRGVWVVAAIYTIALAHAAYFVALFYDFNAATASPSR